MRIPADHEIRALHERYAPSRAAFEAVWTHCVIVSRIAAQFTGGDPALVRAGALLHDVGVHRLGDAAYIRHGVLGHELVREAGHPEALGRFCSRHTGVGITRHDVREQGLPLPEADYLAETAEERLVMYADKFHTKRSPPVFLTAESYLASVRRFGDDKADAFAAMVRDYGEPDLAALSAEYGHAIV